tara:strand:- start:5516 stop:5788 length:273 start_codon:yes stop_codon:yes gene_type:complete
MEEESIMVPVLSEALRIITVVVPTEFADRLELQSLRMVEAFENHPSGMLDDNNKLMQAESYILQTAINSYLDMIEDDPEMYLPRQSGADE